MFCNPFFKVSILNDSFVVLISSATSCRVCGSMIKRISYLVGMVNFHAETVTLTRHCCLRKLFSNASPTTASNARSINCSLLR